MENYIHYIVSIPCVFLTILATYLAFGVEIPTSTGQYLFYGTLTIVCGMMGRKYVDEINYRWALYSGSLRWIFAGLIYFSARILAILFQVSDPGSFQELLSLYYLVELPAMILGYILPVAFSDMLSHRKS